MYPKRIVIFIALSIILIGACIARLADMQLRDSSFYQEKINDLKARQGISRQLNTLRGSIIDRNGNILAEDNPTFKLKIDYDLSRFMDPRVTEALLLKASRSLEPGKNISNVKQKIKAGKEELNTIIDKCFLFGLSKDRITERINSINDEIWAIRTFQAWRKNCSDSPLYQENKNNIGSVHASEFIPDFEKQIPDPKERLLKVLAIDLYEMHQGHDLFTLKTDDDIFTAQFEFMNIEGIKIDARSTRDYPYHSTACHIIGWVGPAQKRHKKMFEDDRLASYLADEVCGRAGTEYVCESWLRGKRGEKIYDIDNNLIDQEKTEFGLNVRLTLDIELQQRIESMLTDPVLNPENYQVPSAAVVIEVESGDILAAASVPAYDLNEIRYQYGRLLNDPHKPLIDRAMYSIYPPGSVVKPLIYIIGMEHGKITSDQVISCPGHDPPPKWPRCWIQKRHKWLGHDNQWLNNGRNAIKGSCNIYFSRLANRIESRPMQKWLYDFGYGRQVDLAPASVTRRHRQSPGAISSTNPPYGSWIDDFSDIPTLNNNERRWFGIGQGNFRVTPLQVADTMATLARRGIRKQPRLYLDEPQKKPVSLDISDHTINTALEGMDAVVNESGGTANKEFAPADFQSQGIKVYGKTGSTERPYHAWFSGFAEDQKGNKVAFSVLVEGGEHGSSDAAPLAVEIVQYCIEAGYIGNYKSENEQS